MDWPYIVLIIFAVSFFIAIFITLFFVIRNSVHKKFVLKHSFLLRQLMDINSRYRFYKLSNTHLEYDFDHEVNFNNVSCSDYLIGYMNENIKHFKELLNTTEYNRNNYIVYKDEVSRLDKNQGFNVERKLLNKNKLIKYENKLFRKLLLEPTLYLDITVRLSYYNMGGYFKGSKTQTIKEEKIKEYMRGLNNKSGYYYNDEKIWNALTRYERGKVSLRMRFAIFERDNYTCKRCGRSGHRADLEIDHIVPISKGGKSTYSNLQTLCHDCNYHKGSNTAKY